MAKTSRSMRIEDEVWAKAQQQADRLGISVAAYLSLLISGYRVRVEPVKRPQVQVGGIMVDDVPTDPFA